MHWTFMTLLHAAKHGLQECVEMVLKLMGAQPNINDFVEPLQMAAVKGHIKCVRVLLQNSAPVNTKNTRQRLLSSSRTCQYAPTVSPVEFKKTPRETSELPANRMCCRATVLLFTLPSTHTLVASLRHVNININTTKTGSATRRVVPRL